VITRLDGAIDYTVETSASGSEEAGGGIRVSVSLFDENGNEAAAGTGIAGTLKVENPRLWKVRDAYLYRLWVRLHSGGALVDEWYEDIGIRTVEIRGTEILLNGEPVYLKGFGKHEDSDIAGRGFNPVVMKRDFELMKWIGADTDGGLHKLPSVQWTQEYQIEILEMNHRVFDAYAFVKGEQVWTFADFQTGEGIHRVDGNKKGIFTRQRQPKAAAFYLKQRWESLPLNYKAQE
jgi:beta-galactosidase/beta-glucuronidase